MLSQIDIRYSVSETLADVKGLVNAFPGNLTLCLENNTLYQYKEYATAGEMPVPDDIAVVQTNDATLLSRWIAIDAYTGKSFYGAFKTTDWVYNATDNTYTYKIIFNNKLNGCMIKFLDKDRREVLLEDVVEQVVGDGLQSITGIVGATPDCRFDGMYFIYFDKLR